MGREKKQSDRISIDSHRARIIRWIGLVVPFLLVAYSVYLQFSAENNSSLAPSFEFIAINTGWIVLGLFQFVMPSKTLKAALVNLSLYHILALLYIIFISGFDMPLIYTWSILLLASAVYLGQGGVNMSLVALSSTAMISVIINASDDQKVASIIAHFIGTIVVSLLIKLILSAQSVDQEEVSRSHAAEALQRNRVFTIVNNLSDAIISTDRNGVIKLYNAATLNLLDTNIEIVGKSIDDVISLTDLDKKPFSLKKELKSAKSSTVRDDIIAEISDETVRLAITYSPIRSANSADTANNGYVVILRDITKQKSLEDERDEFISVVSHELRTPITVAEGSLSNALLMIKRPDIPQDRISTSVQSAHEQVVFLARMINDLSTLSRAERGVADTPEIIDVQELLHELFNEYAPQAAQKSLKLDLEIAPKLGEVNVSQLYLKELLQNFITNAIKYTQKGSITIMAHKRSGGMIEFAVSDTGIGISRSDQANLYKKFWRSEDYRTRETSGTGLGLYVCAKLAKKLGTTIQLKSRLNHGSTFSFVLPRSNEKK